MIRGQFCCRDDKAVVNRYTKTKFARRRREKDEDVILAATGKKLGNSPSMNTVRSVSTLSTGVSSKIGRKNSIEKDFEYLAPSVHHLKTSLMSYLRENGMGPSTKVHDAKNVLRKATPVSVSTRNKRENKPYVDCIGIHNEDHAGRATHQLCYTWTFTFGSIIDALSNYCREKELDSRRTYVWIDCLCTVLNQNSEQEQSHSTFEEFESAFSKRMKGIPNLVVVMTPWNDPRCLKRMWCLLEIFYSLSNKKGNIDVAVPSKDYYKFLKTLRRGCQGSTSNIGIDELFNIITHIAIERTTSSVTSDMQHILDLVNKIGIDKVNATIIKFMKKWMLGTIRIGLDKVESECKDYLREEQVEMRSNISLFVDFIARYLSDYGDHKEALSFYQKQFFILENAQVKYIFRAKKSSCLLNIGTEYYILGDFENALRKFQEALLIREEVFGIDHEKTGSLYLKIGGTLKSLGEIEEALNFINKSIFIYENLRGAKCNELTLAYDYAGRIHRRRGDPKKAHVLYTKSLEVQSNKYGRSHLNIGTCHYSIGITSYEMGDYESAIFHYKNAMSIYTSVYGMEHPYTAGSYYNLGRTYYANGEFENALTHFSRSNKAYRNSYGESHVDTLDAKKWMIITKKTLAEPKLYSKVEI